jgi:nanoRNase/pAp phosphatase (c-di-AMP/oligoRNAs hydrolase)
VDKKKHLLKKLIQLGKVCLYGVLFPNDLVFFRQVQHLVSKAVVIEHSVEELIISTSELICVSWVLEEVPAFLTIATVVFQAMKRNAWDNVISTLSRMQEKQIFQIPLDSFHLTRDNVSQHTHAETSIAVRHCFRIL